MADILIKGMKMPKSCDECWMTYEGDSDNCPVVNESVAKYMVEEKRHPSCPLVELPPHGRLGDLDFLSETIDSSVFWDTSDYSLIRDIVKNAPTVLEANNG